MRAHTHTHTPYKLAPSFRNPAGERGEGKQVATPLLLLPLGGGQSARTISMGRSQLLRRCGQAARGRGQEARHHHPPKKTRHVADC